MDDVVTATIRTCVNGNAECLNGVILAQNSIAVPEDRANRGRSTPHGCCPHSHAQDRTLAAMQAGWAASLYRISLERQKAAMPRKAE